MERQQRIKEIQEKKAGALLERMRRKTEEAIEIFDREQTDKRAAQLAVEQDLRLQRESQKAAQPKLQQEQEELKRKQAQQRELELLMQKEAKANKLIQLQKNFASAEKIAEERWLQYKVRREEKKRQKRRQRQREKEKEIK